MGRPGQQEGVVGTPHSPASVSQAGRGSIVHLDERPAVSPVAQSSPGAWGHHPQMIFPRGTMWFDQ